MHIQLWLDRDAGLIDPELFSKKAEDLAKQVRRDCDSNDKLNKPTQLRKFYDEVIQFNSTVKKVPADQQDAEFTRMLPYLKMLNAKAAYAKGRGLISDTFKDFISSSLQQIRTKKDCDVFFNLFEAFMGFYKYFYENRSEEEEKRHAQGGR
jgi:CRISPR-associated protein Csm2